MDKSAEAVEEIYSEGKSKLKEGYTKAQQKIDDLMKGTQDTASRSWEDFKDYCRDHPAQALGIAVAAGAVVGFALTKTFSRAEAPVEQRIRNVVRNSQETWQDVKEGFEQAMSGIRGVIDAVKR